MQSINLIDATPLFQCKNELSQQDLKEQKMCFPHIINNNHAPKRI